MAKKYRVHKTYSFDGEVCERWEELCESQGKNYSERLEEYMSRELDDYERRFNENPVIESVTLTPSGEFEQTINQRIVPMLNKDNIQLTVEDKGILDTILISAKRLVGKVETKLSLLRIVRFSKISNIDRLEMTRLAQLQSAKEYQAKKECLNLMKELPLPIEEVHTLYNGEIDTLSEAQLWELQQAEERRRMKLRKPDRPPLPISNEVINEEIIEE